MGRCDIVAISQIGMIIRRRRIELGLSQEDLADGICAVTTLSRIENGERMPTQNHLEMLLQRIGYSDMMTESFVDEKSFVLHELKFKIRQANIEGDTQSAKELLGEFEALLTKPTIIDQQFLLHQKILLNQSNYSQDEKLELLEKAITLTQPKYRQGKLPYLLSYEEIKLLNSIALLRSGKGHRREAIDILYCILDFYDTHIVNAEEILRTEPMVLYNLSKILGLENRYDECLDICDKGILLAQKTGRCPCLHLMLYNKAWILLKKNRSEHLLKATDLANSAYYVAYALNDQKFMSHCQKFMTDNGLELRHCISQT